MFLTVGSKRSSQYIYVHVGSVIYLKDTTNPLRSEVITHPLGLDRRDGSLVGSADDDRTRVGNGSSGSGGTGDGIHDEVGDDGSYNELDDPIRVHGTTSDVNVSN